MKRYLLMATTLFLAISNVSGQLTESEQYSRLPSVEVLPTVVFQEKTPLRIESFVVLEASSGRIQTFYSVKNVGAKDIRYYKVARWFSDNTGTVMNAMIPKNGLLKSQQTISNIPTAVTDPAHSKRKPLPPSLRKIAFIMIVEIGFADGTTLSFEEDITALESHLGRFEIIYDEDGQ
jgi:hypothetical protein